jgi:UPF0288 family protein (methanogenesis marker protein 3)
VHWYDFFLKRRLPRYICWLIDEYTTTDIRWLTDECMRLCSFGEDIFLGSSTEEYITVIFLGAEEFKKHEEHMIFSYSAMFQPKAGRWVF